MRGETVDLSFSPADEQFRCYFRAWLDENLPTSWRDRSAFQGLAEAKTFEMRRMWEADKARAGWAGIEWPVEYGGRGGTATQRAIYDQEMVRAHAPRTVNALGLTFLAPTVMAFGTEEQKRAILKPLLLNEVIWCQGFSEPGAGSDLAALITRADDRGDHWLVNGQKVWTTHATRGDMIFTLCRTDPAATRHAGISMLLIDIRPEGVEARPLRQLTGASEFGEVLFTDVRVPKSSTLGPVDGGWNVAMKLLSFERGASALEQYTTYLDEYQQIVEYAKTHERFGVTAAQDPVIRQKLAASYIEIELLRLQSLHVLTQVEQRAELGVGSSITKLQWSETHQSMGTLFFDIAELAGQDTPDGLSGLQQAALWSILETILGGSSQIQRNLIAERILGLPR
jgi:alkylation response protein AidB-like acyl-CoA dehydrogenase